jgi:hypothetical protein
MLVQAPAIEVGLRARRHIARRLMPYLFTLYAINFLDRMNVGAAALQMPKDLGFSDRAVGLGAGIFFGSEREFVEIRILGCFLKNDEFGLGDRHALRFEQQVDEIFVAAAPSKKGFDVAVDRFDHSESYFRATVV